MDVEVIDATFKYPFSMIVSGSSQSGKTEFVINLIRKRSLLLDTQIDYVIWVYGHKTKRISDIQKEFGKFIILYDHLPDSFENIYKQTKGKNIMIVLDDLMEETGNSKAVLNLFIKECHHRNLAVILIMQDMFFNSNYRVTFVRNSNYLVLMRSPMDMGVADSIARKLMPRNQKLFFEIFEKATTEQFSHLCISGHPKTNPRVKYRSHIFDIPQIVYEIKHKRNMK